MWFWIDKAKRSLLLSSSWVYRRGESFWDPGSSFLYDKENFRRRRRGSEWQGRAIRNVWVIRRKERTTISWKRERSSLTTTEWAVLGVRLIHSSKKVCRHFSRPMTGLLYSRTVSQSPHIFLCGETMVKVFRRRIGWWVRSCISKHTVSSKYGALGGLVLIWKDQVKIINQ